MLIGVEAVLKLEFVERDTHTNKYVCVRLALGADLTNVLWLVTAFYSGDNPYSQQYNLKGLLHDTPTNHLHDWHLQVGSPGIFMAL